MSSNDISPDLRVDLDVAFRATPNDVRVMRALRAETPSWLELGQDELEALLPAAAWVRGPAPAPNRTPFTLEDTSEGPECPRKASRDRRDPSAV